MLIAAFAYLDFAINPHSVFRKVFLRPAPVYRWVQFDDKTFSFLPGEGKAWGPVDPQQGEIHYALNSYLPVDTGLMDLAEWGEKMDAWSAMKTSSICYESKIVSSSKVCQVQSGKPQLIFIRDVRAKQFGLGEVPGASSGKKGVQDQNSVTVTIFAWKCVENCK